MILFFLFSTVIALIIYSWISLIIDAKRTKLSGPFPLPIIGNGHLFFGDSTHFLNKIGEMTVKYSGVSLFYILSHRYVLLKDLKHVEALASSTDLIMKGRSYDFLDPWLGQGLLTSSGYKWKMHRKFLTPAFHFNILQKFLPIFLKNGNVLLKKFDKLAGADIDLFPVIALAALDNVTESIMGVSVKAQINTESEYVKAIANISDILAYRIRNGIAAIDVLFNLTPMKKKQDKAITILHKYARSVIEARQKELENLNITSLNYDSDHGIKNRHAFLDLLLLAELDGKKIEAESIREEVDTFMFEGHDTTTSGVSFSLFCIAEHEEVQEKILEEQNAILGDDLERDPTYSEFQQMKYLDMVLKESMRLYPPVPLIERWIHKDTELAGTFIPKNTSVLINIFEIQRDPDSFENPLEFRPERFETTLKNPFSFIAFSAGPRNCIGQKFAMLQMKTIISKLVRHFKILPSAKKPVLGAELILKAKSGVFIQLARR